MEFVEFIKVYKEVVYGVVGSYLGGRKWVFFVGCVDFLGFFCY